MSRDQTKKIILRYVLAHPDAKDAINGIAEYWITRQKVSEQLDEVVGVVDELVGEGILIERVGPGGTCIYSLNKDMLDEIKQMAEQ